MFISDGASVPGVVREKDVALAVALKLGLYLEKNLDVKFRYAETLIFSHNYKKAIEVMNDIEVETGLSPRLSLTKHDLYLQLKDPEAAQMEIEKFIQDDPANMENRMVIADYFLNTSQPEKLTRSVVRISGA